MFSLIKYLIYIALIAGVVAFFMKPDDAVCIDRGVAQIRSELQEKVSGIKIEGLAGEIADLAIKKAIRVEDKILYKEILFTWNDTPRVVGYGLFGGVFIKEKTVSEK